jgi:hypothetical protein
MISTIENKDRKEIMPNPYIATLNKFRKAMKRVRSKRFCETLSFAARASRSYGYTDSRPSSMHSIMALPDATDDIIEPSVAALLGNPDYFAPLLAPLKHLSIDEGWRLDGVLRGGGFNSFLDLLVTNDKTSEFPFAHHVHLDGSAESVWEAHILRIGGDILYLGWHAAYDQLSIITSYDTLAAETRDLTVSADKAIEEIGERSRELERWDFTPKVEASDTQGIVTFCIYSPFGGFKKIKETLRIAPFERIAMETVAEIPYECGVYF